LSKNENVKRGLGNTIAKSSDNVIVKTLATNETVQDSVAWGVQKTIGNKEVQKQIGNKVSELAKDKEVQKKVATGLVTVAKGTAKGGAWLGAVGVSALKYGYNEYTKDKDSTK
jgi:ribosomal protein L18